MQTHFFYFCRVKMTKRVCPSLGPLVGNAYPFWPASRDKLTRVTVSVS